VGEHDVSAPADEQEAAAFTRAVLRDLDALERMLAEGRLESGVRRIGAEQEMFLVNADLLPASVSPEVLETAADHRLTTEIGRFNLEANCRPLPLAPGCLDRVEAQLHDVVAVADAAARQHGARVLLCGILPTLRAADLSLRTITPLPRYRELDQGLRRLRGAPFRVQLAGADTLDVSSEDVMLEAANTSFQVHLQVDPADFAAWYNAAQLVTVPLVAAAGCSPLLFGRRLWHETRIALFQQAVDERSEAQQARGGPTRVGFGERWASGSVLDVLREQVLRFSTVLTRPLSEDPLEVLDRGGAPALGALALHNGTVWRWNRACYGVLDGRPSLRIENRALPAGPTIADEVANAAFFLGLVCAVVERYGDVAPLLDFTEVRTAFLAAARYGLDVTLPWVAGPARPAPDLFAELIPAAADGLTAAGVGAEEVRRHLDVLDERVRRRRTGSAWLLAGRRDATLLAERALVASMLERQASGEPVARWEPADPPALAPRVVADVMTTDVYTVAPAEPADLAARVIEWQRVGQVPVEDEGRLVGVVSAEGLRGDAGLARDVMNTDVVTVSPQTSVEAAAALLRDGAGAALPVVEDGHLVGIVTAADLRGRAGG
jgi:CBS domain-containing protein